MTRCSGWVATILLLLSCREVTTNLVSDPDAAMDGGGGVRDGGGGGADAAAGMDAAAPVDAGLDGGVRCGGRVCACDDGLDSDGDGLVDGFDPECTAAFDNDESSFATGTPNPQNDCRDCFWDRNAGSDEGCRYPMQCFTDQNFQGNGACGSCQPSATCVGNCLGVTPNGCDCFGCCQVTREDGTVIDIRLEESCSLEKLDDEAACPRCTHNTACFNDCGECELCAGKKPSDLPASCGSGQTDAGVGHSCNHGLQACSESISCQGTGYCQQGCCLLTVF